MSFTLLSLWLTSSWQKQLAAARTAVGADDSCTSVTAHSYLQRGVAATGRSGSG